MAISFYTGHFRDSLSRIAPSRSIALLLLTLSMVLCCPCASQAETATVRSYLKFVSGLVTAYVVHEAGHAAAGFVTNTELDWGIGTYNQPLGYTENVDSAGDGLLINASGLVTQVLASEVILRTEKIDPNDAFVRGMMLWNIINPLIYAADFWFIRQTNRTVDSTYQGDIEGVEYYSDKNSADLFAVMISALAICQGYRFMQTQTWAPEWIKSEQVRLDFLAGAQSEVGFCLRFSF